MFRPSAVAASAIGAAMTILWSGLGLCQTAPNAPHYILEAYPDAIEARIELHHRAIAAAAQNVRSVPFYLIVPKLNRWAPGSTVRVAFNGGNDALYAQIEAAASDWIKPGVANLRLQFKDQHGAYLKWNSSDTQYAAEIRVTFTAGAGYWSYVGTDSDDRSLSGPGEASLNLDSFDKQLPSDWRGVTLHEFGHAFGFQHEHQNPSGGCDFRFDDDPGYVPTKDQDGWYVTDSNGRRPGLYTYLGGYANFWPKAKVDANLRALPVSSAYLVGTFDKRSIMKYFFDASMFNAGASSPCYTPSENLALSDQDKIGAREAYSTDTVAVAAAILEKKKLLREILASPNASSELIESSKVSLDKLQ